jgi:hypothetical protein
MAFMRPGVPIASTGPQSSPWPSDGPSGNAGYPGFAPTPGPYNPTITQQNVAGTVPGPLAPQLMAYWQQPDTLLMWGDASEQGLALYGGTSYVTQRAVWATPTFDLRPEFRGSAGLTPQGVPISRGTFYGLGASLACQVFLSGEIPNDLYITTMEFGTIYDAQNSMAALGRPVDVTSVLGDGVGAASGNLRSALFNWRPPASPIRFWRVALIFNTYSTNENLPALRVTGGAS